MSHSDSTTDAKTPAGISDSDVAVVAASASPASAASTAKGARPKPVKARPARKPQAVAAAAVVDTDVEDDRPRLLAFFFDGSSSWLVSMVVHMVLVLVLGILTVTASQESKHPALIASIDGEELDDLEESTPYEGLDNPQLDQSQAIAVSIEAPGMADFGQPEGVDVQSDVGNIQLASSIGDVGALFGTEGQGYASVGDGAGGAEFFGVKAGGRRFVFMVDGSSSMRRNGWEFCKRELISSVNRLKPTQLFYVILFADKDYRMFGSGQEAEKMLPADSKNIARLQRWLYDYELKSSTRPLSSVQFSLDKLKPDAAYLLTDGQFNDGTVEYLRQKNRREGTYGDMVPRMSVHTIGFFSDKGREVLTQIAKENTGSFRFVAPPPGYKPPPRGGR